MFVKRKVHKVTRGCIWNGYRERLLDPSLRPFPTVKPEEWVTWYNVATEVLFR